MRDTLGYQVCACGRTFYDFTRDTPARCYVCRARITGPSPQDGARAPRARHVRTEPLVAEAEAAAIFDP